MGPPSVLTREPDGAMTVEELHGWLDPLLAQAAKRLERCPASEIGRMSFVVTHLTAAAAHLLVLREQQKL